MSKPPKLTTREKATVLGDSTDLTNDLLAYATWIAEYKYGGKPTPVRVLAILASDLMSHYKADRARAKADFREWQRFIRSGSRALLRDIKSRDQGVAA
jgi:hypothetical protein